MSQGPLQVPAPRFSLPVLEEFSEMVGRPLFVQSRRPVDVAEAQGDASVPPARSTTQNNPNDYRLTGVVIAEGEAVALLQGRSEETVTRLRVGETLDAWSVREIHPDRVLLVDGREKREIVLWRFEPLPQTKPATSRRQARNTSRGESRGPPSRQSRRNLPQMRVPQRDPK